MYFEVNNVNKCCHVVHLEGVLVKHRARMQSAMLHLMYARDALKPGSVTPLRNILLKILCCFFLSLPRSMYFSCVAATFRNV